MGRESTKSRDVGREVQFHIRGKQELDSQDDPRRLEELSACHVFVFPIKKRERGGAGLAAHALCVCEQSSGTVVTWSKDRLGGPCLLHVQWPAA